MTLHFQECRMKEKKGDADMIYWKTCGADVLSALKEKGYNTTRLRREKLLSEVTIQRLRDDKMVSIDSLNSICNMLNCKPQKIIDWKSDDK